MDFSEAETARMVLSALSEPGDGATNAIVRAVGPVDTLRLIRTANAAVPLLNEEHAELWRRRLGGRLAAGLEDELSSNTERLGLHFLTPNEPRWPDGLSDLGDRAPLALWARGNCELLTSTASTRVAIIGSRAATAYGEHVAGELASDLALSPRIIASGGAYGIDAAAHRAALAARPRSSIAVLACGVDRAYPVGNTDLFDRLAEQGLILSSLPPGSAPTRWRFEQRGILLAAFSGGTVLVEAGGRSGALRTAESAHRLGRPVGAVPGPVTSPTSVGCHRLIQQGIATVVTDAREVIALLDGKVAPAHEITVGRSVGYAGAELSGSDIGL